MAKISVSDVQGEVDYEKTAKEFGIDSMHGFLKKLPDAPAMYRRGLVFGQRDFQQIYDATKNRRKFAVLTGVNPSGSLHLGNKLFIDQALYFQRCGADVIIPISNDETYVFHKADSLEKATENAVNNVIPDLIALGFEPKRTKIFISTKTLRIFELAIKISTKATFSTVKAVFGFNNDTNPGQIFYSIVQSAHILFPQTMGYRETVVPIGIDQDPYMRLVRDIADRLGMVKPSSTYHKFMPGLQGGKMSGSKPETCIYLTDSPEAARKKIMSAFSGGGGSLAEHRKSGGNPDVDVAFQYLRFMFEQDDKKLEEIRTSFKKGDMTSGELKGYTADRIEAFLRNHQKEREKANSKTDKFMID
ncbi:MAG: tryptophan--tRNA ligase [Candidatus Aenigmarchaeota archaeon]|nr:tryptophan--tRNA ligase [Candidatus Aenigmarchaeota archaeon]